MLCPGFTLAVLLSALPRLEAQTTGTEKRTLTRVSEVRSLSRAEAARGLSVKVLGRVEWIRGSGGMDFTMTDGTASVYALNYGEDHGVARDVRDVKAVAEPLEVGDKIELEGVTSAGGYAPVVVAKRVTKRSGTQRQRQRQRQGQGQGQGQGQAQSCEPAGPARRVTIAHLSGGHEDAQRVELDSVVVQSVIDHPADDQRALRVCDGSGDYTLLSVKRAPWNEAEKVIDAEVRVRGTVLTLFNSRLEQTGVRLAVPSPGDFQMLKPPPPDPFSAPRVEIGALRIFRPEGSTPHRRVVEGTVTWVSALEMVIENEGRGVRVAVTATQGLRLGDRVMLAGFVEARQPIAFLTNAVVRRLSPGTPPPAAETTVEEILELSRENSGRFWGLHPKDFDHRLVRLEGTTSAEVPAGARTILLLTETGRQVEAGFPSGSAGNGRMLPAGCFVKVTGVATVRHGPGDPLPEFRRPTGLELLLRGPEDLVVVHGPSWWTLPRLRLALFGAAAVLGLVLAWVLLLRRTVRRQARRIEWALRTHRDAELEHDAAKRERVRLAGDLHDGVHQLLSAASYRLESVTLLSASDPAAALPHVAAAKKILDRSQHEMRSIMWGIHELAKAGPDFPELLTHALAGMDHWPPDVVRVTRRGESRPVPARAAGSLLLLTQEAVQNALNHGAATDIAVEVDFTRDSLCLTIADNGHGFDPALSRPTPQGGLGLGSMKRRADELGGTLELTSGAGTGTRIHIRLPWTGLQPFFPKSPTSAPAT